MALVYFITFHTYGTWLHGTSKGKGSVDREHNQYGGAFVAPDAQREAQSPDRMEQPPYVLRSAGEREVVRDAIVSLCRQRSWRLLALHVRTNHVHVVVSANLDPGRLMSDLNARASGELKRRGFDDASRRRWTRHGSTLHLFNEEAVADKNARCWRTTTRARSGTPRSKRAPGGAPTAYCAEYRSVRGS